ncbi:MAG TPA: glycoside hydrolase family 15 protein [Planctomycetota bacterium]|nr:glycoside hydrolase family 15 protein [Planctomycetota bacterium]
MPTPIRLEQLGLIGNCQFSALVAETGEIVWCCLPRFDSEPVFSALLDAEAGGRFAVGPVAGATSRLAYLPNSNVLETIHEGPDGRFRVIDFAPRFEQHGRYFRPTMLVRMLQPLSGTPRARVACEPLLGWSRRTPPRVQGSNHVEFGGFESRLRLTTDIPLSYLGGRPFVLDGPHHLVLTWGEPVEQPLRALCERFLRETLRYWERWVKQCNIPPFWQEHVIRSALALKLHCFEDTGAIVAATTTSIPEAPGSGRTWDYRYCWLRDSYYVLAAFRRLGQFEERERFVHYLLNIVADRPDLDLAPLYRVDGTTEGLEERILEDWPGYAGEKPVRVGNGALAQKQHDIYGELLLSLAPIFLDERFRADRSAQSLELLERLARKAVEVAGTPDAGIWEFRGNSRVQTFSTLMCWAAADRMAKVAERHLPDRVERYRRDAAAIHRQLIEQAWNPELGAFVSTHGGNELDASLLQMAPLHFLPADDARLHSTVDRLSRDLAHDGWLFRYRSEDDFGRPEVAFIMCTFWLIEALARLGRADEAREVLKQARKAPLPLGLLSEDFATRDLRMWGNFPQAYSHVGLIHAAFAASPRWSDLL